MSDFSLAKAFYLAAMAGLLEEGDAPGKVPLGGNRGEDLRFSWH